VPRTAQQAAAALAVVEAPVPVVGVVRAAELLVVPPLQIAQPQTVPQRSRTLGRAQAAPAAQAQRAVRPRAPVEVAPPRSPRTAPAPPAPLRPPAPRADRLLRRLRPPCQLQPPASPNNLASQQKPPSLPHQRPGLPTMIHRARRLATARAHVDRNPINRRPALYTPARALTTNMKTLIVRDCYPRGCTLTPASCATP
jgi:hypothetical protein